MHPLTQTLLSTAALSAILSASLTIYLLALKLVAWDLVPISALPHITWWRRHLRPCLYTTLIITTTAATAAALLR
jgi:hypothetical protein